MKLKQLTIVNLLLLFFLSTTVIYSSFGFIATDTPIIDGVISNDEYLASKSFSSGDYMLYWQIEGDMIYFGIEVDTSGWVAVGFEPTFAMKDADMVFAWVESNGTVVIFDVYATGNYGPHPPDVDQGGTFDILSYDGLEGSGKTTIEFSRKLNTGDTYDKIIPTSGTFNIIWATGTADNFGLQHDRRGSASLNMEEGLVKAVVEVEDQPIVDGRVWIPKVDSVGPGWIVIHNQTTGETFGAILGYTHLENGTNEKILVKLDLSKRTDTLFAMLHTDAGVIGTFEFPGVDGPVKDAQDNIIAPSFKISDVLDSSVSVSNQPVVDDKVTIDSIVSSGFGWIVIHNKTNTGTPGTILGYKELDHGVNPYIIVEIEEESRTETVFAMLHADNGTYGSFEFPGPDGPVKDSSDQVITPAFNITYIFTSSVMIEDQEIVNDKVTVNQAIIAGLGWIVIHADNVGSPGSILGYTQVFHGVNSNIEVSLSTSDRTSTMYAMLYTDEDELGVFEFPGSDIPVKDDSGNVITPSFIITNFTEPTTTTTSTTTLSTPGFTLLPVLTLLGLAVFFFRERKQ